jgi:outer membrane biogenesis lipoprotein LolB
MSKALAYALALSASLGLAACDSKSEQKAQDAQAHTENAQQKTETAQEHLQDAQKETAEAHKDHAQAREAAAEENKTFVPDSDGPASIQTPDQK